MLSPSLWILRFAQDDRKKFALSAYSGEEARVKITPLGDCAFVVELADSIGDESLARVSAFARELEKKPPRGALEI
ncbi:MAG: hypothetical protein KGJ37_04720, partial [Verrucomicrobiota bacterium]|nr:hypothetical protein [Verrucomicrobiota bacterium]